MPRGGKRANSGRKTKTEEQALIDRLTPLDDIGFEMMEEGMRQGNYQYVKMFFEYRYGKPTEKIKVGGDKDNPVIHKIIIEDVDGTEI